MGGRWGAVEGRRDVEVAKSELARLSLLLPPPSQRRPSLILLDSLTSSSSSSEDPSRWHDQLFSPFFLRSLASYTCWSLVVWSLRPIADPG